MPTQNDTNDPWWGEIGMVEMRNRGARKLYQYWHEAKGGQEVPVRKSIQPRGLQDVLQWVFILERVDRELAPFRLAGTGLCDQYGGELGGTNFLSLCLGDCRRTVRSLIDNVVMMPAAAFIEFEAHAKNKGRMSGEIVLLPLADEQGEVHQILGGWFPSMAQDAYLEKPLVRHRITNIRILSDFDPAALPSEDGTAQPRLKLVISDGKVIGS